MKKIGLIIILLVSICAVNAQQQSITSVQRYRGKLAIESLDEITKPVSLTKMQLQSMLSEQQFKDYKVARNCYIASIPLFALSGCGIAITTTWIGMGMYSRFSDGSKGDTVMMYILAGTTLAGTLAPLVPAIVLHVRGKKQLNKLALDYNSQHKIPYQPVKLHLGLIDNGIGMKLVF